MRIDWAFMAFWALATTLLGLTARVNLPSFNMFDSVAKLEAPSAVLSEDSVPLNSLLLHAFKFLPHRSDILSMSFLNEPTSVI